MPSIDLSPWLLLVLPMWGLCVYVTYRGLVRNEFRERGRRGWYKYKTGSLDWILSAIANVLFLAVFSFLTFQAVFHGSTFFSLETANADRATIYCDNATSEVRADACSTQ